MAYRCVHCSKIHKDASREILQGCECGSKFFFYIKDDKLPLIEDETKEFNLSKGEKEQIERDVRDIAGVTNDEVPVFLDFESIKIVKPGKYLLDLTKLFSINKPRVYKLEDGKYIVDLVSPLKRINPKELV